jgi:hypothetical protein
VKYLIIAIAIMLTSCSAKIGKLADISAQKDVSAMFSEVNVKQTPDLVKIEDTTIIYFNSDAQDQAKEVMIKNFDDRKETYIKIFGGE